MNANVPPVLNKKKIIAREGLIILGVLTVAGLCVLTGNMIAKYAPPEPPTWEEANRALDVPTGRLYTNEELVRYKALKNTRVLQPKKSSNLTPKEHAELLALEKENEVAQAARAKFEVNRAGLIAKRDARLGLAGDFLGVGYIVVLLFAYPVYLLVRFVVWAIRTLRN